MLQPPRISKRTPEISYEYPYKASAPAPIRPVTRAAAAAALSVRRLASLARRPPPPSAPSTPPSHRRLPPRSRQGRVARLGVVLGEERSRAAAAESKAKMKKEKVQKEEDNKDEEDNKGEEEKNTGTHPATPATSPPSPPSPTTSLCTWAIPPWVASQRIAGWTNIARTSVFTDRSCRADALPQWPLLSMVQMYMFQMLVEVELEGSCQVRPPVSPMRRNAVNNSINSRPGATRDSDISKWRIFLWFGREISTTVRQVNSVSALLQATKKTEKIEFADLTNRLWRKVFAEFGEEDVFPWPKNHHLIAVAQNGTFEPATSDQRTADREEAKNKWTVHATPENPRFAIGKHPELLAGILSLLGCLAFSGGRANCVSLLNVERRGT
ncbi:hypothetical protein CONLIGDRAFT_685822 [Coniochaeta ligniaria NRRL 30616]|uniref:Uncharacterized protein n=1 Tax=Coniochaeta ligniaria NRRL 30616 TaxID=1408157 RepID=A0A1J7IA54_9PEZI|nr:hypothetical protein CONLIGDRAFT_685822 [Coniochaeta ligniaria NRRL 30616]